MKIKPLNRREISKILKQIGEYYDCDAKFLIDKYSFFISEKNKVYIIDNKIKDIPLDNVRINSLGLYFCELNHNDIRFSIEGSQIIGKIAKKNILELDDKTARLWLKGQDIPSEKQFDSFVIIKNNNDFMGCGKYKEGNILNYIPKIRRITASD